MSGLPASEYRRNFNWNLSEGYSRNCPPDQYKPANIFYRSNSLDFTNASSKIDHKAVAKQFVKLYPQLNGDCNRNEKKSDYEMSLSTYKDTFRKHVRFPSMADYIQIANNVTDNHFPKSVKYFYEPEEVEEYNNSSRSAACLKTVNVRFPKSTDGFLEDEEVGNDDVVPKKSMNPRLLPKITDMGALFYRNDVSPDCMQRRDSLREYVEETNKKIEKAILRNEYEENAKKHPKRKPKRYIDLPVY